MPMSFEEIKKMVGDNDALACVIAHQAGVEYPQESIEEWIEDYKSLGKNYLKDAILEIISQLAKTLKDWLWVYQNSPTDSRLEELAFQKTVKLAQTFEEWFEVYRDSPDSSQLKKEALQKMAELAGTLWEWFKVYQYSLSVNDKQLKKLAIQKIAELIKQRRGKS